MIISPDSQVLLLLCSRLGIREDSALQPLTLREWNPLARKLKEAGLRPDFFLGTNQAYLSTSLDLAPAETERILALVDRGVLIGAELERLENTGIYPVTRADDAYPSRLRQRLKDSAPATLFYSGSRDLLGQPGIAVVGSRHLDPVGVECAEFVGNTCGLSGLVLYSGGAKGVDTLSMNACLAARGTAVGLLADSLTRAVRTPEYRAALERGDLCLATPYSPDAGFSVGTAMGRNKLIYALSDYAIVVASDAEKGGTWAGATEALKAGWVPVFVLEHPHMPEGNRLLLQRGGLPFPHPFSGHHLQLQQWLADKAAEETKKPPSVQLGLF